MSKDNPTQYHSRTIDLFLKSYFEGLPALNEAADVIFSANNLENHNYCVPSFIHDVERYLAKAKIATVADKTLSRREQANIISNRTTQYEGRDKPHNRIPIPMFNFDEWYDCGPNGDNPNPQRRRELCQRFLSWQLPTMPGEDSEFDSEDHPTRHMNWFHSSSSFPSANSTTPITTQYIQAIFNTSEGGVPTRKLMDKAMTDMGVNHRLAQTQNMGKWSNSDNEASYDKQFVDSFKKYRDKFKEIYTSLPIPPKKIQEYADDKDMTEERARLILENTALKHHFLNHKIWEIRGVPNDYIWENLYDDIGFISESATKKLKAKSESRDSSKLRDGFFPLYFGIPLIDYEDKIKFAEWFLDGAGHVDGEDYNRSNPRFDDKAINQILGHNARGFLSRHCSNFAHALHANYSGNIGTSGHNSLPMGEKGRTRGQIEMMQNKDVKKKLLMQGKANSDMTPEKVIRYIDELGITREEQNEVLNRQGLLEKVGDGEDTPNYHAILSEDELKDVMSELAKMHGDSSSTADNMDFLRNVKHLFKLKNQNFFFNPLDGEPELERTPQYYMQRAIGGFEGAMGEAFSHWDDLVYGAFPSVFVHREQPLVDDEEEREPTLPSVKNTYQSAKGKKLSEKKYNERFQADPDDPAHARIKLDLERAMNNAGMSDDAQDKMLERFNEGNGVEVEFPQGFQADREGYSRNVSARQAEEVSEEEYMLDKIPEMGLDKYLEYTPASAPVTAGHSAFIAPLLSHTNALETERNPNHFSADFKHHWLRGIENHNTPMDSIMAMRHARLVSDNIGGVSRSRAKKDTEGNTLRRVGDSTFGRDVRGLEDHSPKKGRIGKKKMDLHSSEISADEAYNRMLMLHTLLFQAHHGIDNYSEEDHKTHNTKQLKPGATYTSKHRDPLGRGDNAGGLYQNELLGGDFDAKIAIYDKDEYESAMKRYEDEGKILRLPTPLRDNITDRTELVQELTAPDDKGNSFHQESNGAMFSELGPASRNRLKRSIKQDSDFTGYYGDGKQYIVALNPLSHYQEALEKYRDSARQAHRDGSTVSATNFEKLATEQGKYIVDNIGELPPITEHEMRKLYFEDAQTMHEQAVAASQIMKPLLKWANPDLFQTHTPKHANQAWADTKMLAHLCETWMRTLSPKERKNWIKNAKVNCSRETGKPVMEILQEHFKDKGMSDSAIEQQIDGLIKDTTAPMMRQFFQAGDIKRNVDMGEDNSVMGLMQKYVNGELDSAHYPLELAGKVNNNELVKKIFDEVRRVLPKDATSQDFADVLHARYIPHSAKQMIENEEGEENETGGQNLMRIMTPQSLVGFGQGSGRSTDDGDFVGRVYGYKSVTGGHHHNAEIDEDNPLMSGGDAITNKMGKPYKMHAEIKALNAVYHALVKHSKGSANGIDTVARKTAPLPKTKGDEGFNDLTNRMETFIQRLKGDVKGVNNEIGKINTNSRHVGTGGMGVNELQLPAVHTCSAANKKLGHVIRPSHRIATHALRSNALIIHDDKGDFHQGDLLMRASLDPYRLRDFDSALPPYDVSADKGTQFPPVAMQPSGIPGQSVNSNLPVFSGMGSGQQLLLSDSEMLDSLTDDTLIFKEDGRPVPMKSMHRIFDLSDLKHLRGFSGDWIASHIPKGEPVILQKKGKRVKAYNADMKLVELADCCEEDMGKVNDKDFVVHAIVDGDKLYFIDLLEAADEKTHNMPAKDRVRHLRAHFESTETIKMPEPYNTKRTDDEGLEEAVHLLREESPCDILLRDASATYMRGEIRHPKWILLSKEKKIDVIILDRKGMNYRIGIGPIMHPEHYGARSVELNGEHYMDVGTAKGPRGYDKGEYITVFCTGVTSKGDENPTYTIRSARVDRDAHPQAADSVESLSMMCSDSKIPHKVRLNKGAIHILFPSLDDEVIYKVNEEEGGWMLEPQNTLWGHGEEYFIKLSEDLRPHWTPIATILLKKDKEKAFNTPKRYKSKEVDPEAPAGHTKERKKVLPKEEEVIKRGLEMAELMLERVSKEKITHTGVEGLGIDYAGADVESPRGPTTNMNDDTLPDFDPSSREYKEKRATTDKKPKVIRTTAGEEGVTDYKGNVTITQPRV